MKKQWQLSLLALLFVPLLMCLGFWQLERAEEKQQLLAVYQQQQNLPAQEFSTLGENQSEISYQPIIITGQYDKKHYWLIDSQSRNGKVGYEIIMPLWVDDQWVLVNRGWVIAPRLRSDLPVVETPEKQVTIEGYFHTPSKNRALANSSNDLSQPWPQRVLQLDFEQAETLLNAKVYPQVLRINEESPSALVTQWPVINTSPEKHYGYATQWFLMALAFVFLYAWAIGKK